MKKIKKVEIYDRVFEETYTAHLKKNTTSWLGWIPEVPKVKCEAPTEALLLKTLENKLHQTLEAEEEEWEKQFQADVRSGWLDQLSEQAIQNYKAGKCYDLETIKKNHRK